LGEGLLPLLSALPRGSSAPIATQISLIPSNPKTTRIRFGEGRSATVVEPLDEMPTG
jgi:hypothetical protein